MVAEWCSSSIRTFRICPCRNWKTTRNRFGLKYLPTNLLIMWQAGMVGGSSEDFQLFRDQLDQIRNKHKGNKLPSVHVLGDFNFKDIAWSDRLNKSGSMLSQSEGQILIDIMNAHGLEQLVHFPTREKNTLALILTSLPGQFQEIHFPDKLSDHDVVSGTLKVCIPPKKETSEEGVFVSKRRFWVDEERCIWLCKR